MRKKRIVFILLGMFVFVIAALAFAGNYFFGYSLSPRREERAPGVPESELEAAAAQPRENAYDWLDTFANDTWIESADGLRLRGQRVDKAGTRFLRTVTQPTVAPWRPLASDSMR
jgi:flagellar basal body-associated protein FliL